MSRSRLLTAAALTALLGCQAGETPATPETPEPSAAARVDVAAPLQTDDAYALAEQAPEPDYEVREFPGLHNVIQLSDTIWSGSEPHGEEALKKLSELGIKTILSVDGKVPDAATAAKYGMRYVHVPIRYSGIKQGELKKIAKTFRELEAPFYAHCFHGKHRGPAGAMIGRLALDGATREQALAEMRLCGTASKYRGLYGTVATAEIPSAEATAAWTWTFPAAAPMRGFRHAMVAAPRAYDNLALLAKRDFAADPEHPDLDAVNEAEKIRQVFELSVDMKECQEQAEDFRGWLASSAQASADLHAALTADTPDIAKAHAALKQIKADCKACHGVYRNNTP